VERRGVATRRLEPACGAFACSRTGRPRVSAGPTFLISVGQLVGPFPAGLLAEAAGLEVAFYAGAALTFATLVFVGPRGATVGRVEAARTSSSV
jgi:hypothetical protein